MKTFEEFKQDWREKEKQPLPKGVKFTCACGKHTSPDPLTDEELEELYNMLKEDSMT